MNVVESTHSRRRRTHDDMMKNENQLDLFDFIIHKLSPFVSPDLVCFSPTGMRLLQQEQQQLNFLFFI